MKISFHDNLIARIPRFSLSADLKSEWAELKICISESSPEFFELIKDIPSSELDQLPEKVKFSIWKYFNRSRFRATPYGTFAGLGLFTPVWQTGKTRLQVSSLQHISRFPDWSASLENNYSIRSLISGNVELWANSSFYLLGDQFRYISFLDNRYELSEISYSSYINYLLQQCSIKISLSELQKKVAGSCFADKDLNQHLEFLLESQLLFSSNSPNLLGADFFERMGIKNSKISKNYIISEREVINGTLDSKLKKDLKNLISHLSTLAEKAQVPALDQFKGSFQTKFGHSEVPLLIALDPETGLSYGDQETAIAVNDLAGELQQRKAEQAQTNSSYQQKILDYLNGHSLQSLKAIPLEAITGNKNTKKSAFPNSFSILLSIYDRHTCIDSIGGCTVNALAGRFTLLGEPYTTFCRDISMIEQKANPDVLFFDIGYLSGDESDNINRRAHVYTYQLNLLNFDTSEDPLLLNDILISMQEGEIQLRSKKHGKRLVPRMASAFNYSRSNLPVFRLLCDLQHQNLQSQLSFDLQQILPDLPYYPRLKYNDLILSPAKWQINTQVLQKQANSSEVIKYLQHAGIPSLIKAGHSDQQLRFNLEKEEDLRYFLMYAKNKTDFYVTESFPFRHGMVTGASGESYHFQLQLAVTHSNRIYHPGKHHIEATLNPAIARVIPPGKDWLYFEIYCHEGRADELLQEIIGTWLSKNKSLILKWFFVRYYQSGHHLRLRIQLRPKCTLDQPIINLSTLLQEHLNTGLVSDFLLRSYKPEISRYGPGLIGRVEDNFNLSSQFVLCLLSKPQSTYKKYQSVHRVFSQLISAQLFEPMQILSLLDSVSVSLSQEHQLTGKEFSRLNSDYQNFKRSVIKPFTIQENRKQQNFISSIINILYNSEPSKKRQLCTDLIHMHINRMFPSNQRTHELIIYYFAHKALASKMYRTAKID